MKQANPIINKTAVAAIIFAGLSAYTVWTDLNVYVTRYELSTDKVSENLRIVQVSDFHNDRLLGKKMLDKVRGESPDVIVITGDFIDRNKTDIAYALDTAKKLADIAPVYYVPGNHESAIRNYNDLKEGLVQRGIIMAGAAPITIRTETTIPETVSPNTISPETISRGICLYGIDDPYFVSEDDRSSGAIVEDHLSDITLSNDNLNVLLSHRPEAFAEYAASGFDLVFTGHAHGGQFRFPFIGGLFSPGQGILPEYDAGEFKSGATTMIVSRGIGNSIMPLRIGNPPELVTLDIRPRK